MVGASVTTGWKSRRNAPARMIAPASCLAFSPGEVFLLTHCKATSLLTNSIFDPNSHQPAYGGVRRGGKAYDLRRLRRIRRQLIPSKRCE